MIEILQVLIFGIVLGSIITLGAVGLSLLFGILRFANFAHGDMMTVGAYLALVFVAGLGWPIYAAFPMALAGGAVVAIAIDRVLYKRLRRTAPVILLISSFGVGLMLRSLVQFIWGPQSLVYEPGIQFPLDILGLRIKPDHLVILAGAIILVILLHLFLQYTKMGKAMRAMSDNMDLAEITGIETERVIMWTWALGGALAAGAGVFLAMDTRLQPFMGWNMLLPVFAAAIMGGIGKPYGAIAGGMTVGIAEEMSTLFFSPAYKSAVAFALMVIILIVRPTGLFGGRSR